MTLLCLSSKVSPSVGSADLLQEVQKAHFLWISDGKKDHDSREEFIGGMKQDQDYSKEELACIDKGLALLAMKTDKSVKKVPGKQLLLGELFIISGRPEAGNEGGVTSL